MLAALPMIKLSSRQSRHEALAAGNGHAGSVQHSGEAVPQAKTGEELLDLAKIDVGVLCTLDCGASHPPLCTWQPAREIRPATGAVSTLRVSGLSDYGPVSWFPEADGRAGSVQDDGVEPAPDDDLGAVGRRGRGHQVTRSHSLSARRWKGLCVRHHDPLTLGEYGARFLSGAEDDSSAQWSGGYMSVRPGGHTSILPEPPCSASSHTASVAFGKNVGPEQRARTRTTALAAVPRK